MLGGTKGEIVLGNSPSEKPNEDNKFMAPTIIKNVKPGDSSMQGEIFGPILPIMPVSNIKEAVDYINSQDQPLALYAFSGNKKQTDYLFDNTRSGAACQGDVLLHFAVGVSTKLASRICNLSPISDPSFHFFLLISRHL